MLLRRLDLPYETTKLMRFIKELSKQPQTDLFQQDTSWNTNPRSGPVPLPPGRDRGRLKTTIIGGGAAGFFLAINLKEMVPEMEVCIVERSNRVLRKVELSGGGRCNLTNTFDDVDDLSTVYPRGHRLLKRLFKGFGHQDTCDWFERHGVSLMTQPDHRVFPASQDSHTIIDCFMKEAQRLGVRVVTHSERDEAPTFTAVCTGGSPKREGLKWLEDMGHEIVDPVPSLFTLNIDNKALRSLMGTAVENVTAYIPGHKYRSDGALLITHWGLSGPAILKLSSHEARTLHDNNYRLPLCINWVGVGDVRDELQHIIYNNPQKQLHNYRPFDLPQRLWDYLLTQMFKGDTNRTWKSLNAKEINRMANMLTNDEYQITGKGAFKEEFVTCGGIALKSINPSTLESRHVPGMYFAGEVLDIDGITGGFNFQAAWTTAHTVACAIKERVREKK